MAEFGPYKAAHDAEHIVTELNRYHSREQVMLAPSAVDLPAGLVMAKVTATGQWVPFTVGGAGGAGTPAGVLFAAREASPVNPIRATMSCRGTEVNGYKVTWPAGATQGDIATASAALAQVGILVRY